VDFVDLLTFHSYMDFYPRHCCRAPSPQ